MKNIIFLSITLFFSLNIYSQTIQEIFNSGLTKYYQNKDYQVAIVDYSKVIELDPKFKDIYWLRGIAKRELGDHRGAIADFSKGIELNQSDPLLYSSRGFSKQSLGDYRGAMADCNIALKLDPKSSGGTRHKRIIKA